MPKFNKGDKIVRVHGRHMTVKEGDICTVRDHSDRDYLYLEGHDGSYDDQCFRLVEDEPVVEQPTPKKLTVSAAIQITHSDAELGHMQSRFETDRELIEFKIAGLQAELAVKREALAKRMEEHQALLDEYGVEDI